MLPMGLKALRYFILDNGKNTWTLSVPVERPQKPSRLFNPDQRVTSSCEFSAFEYDPDSCLSVVLFDWIYIG